MKKHNITIVRFISFSFFLFTGWISTAQNTQGFFLNDFASKTASIPSFTEYAKPTGAATATVTIDMNNPVTKVSKYLFGNNANVYMTQMVDQPELIKSIKSLAPNVIRFPGGNISSVYFWNAAKDQPPADAPAKLLDANGAEQNPGYWYGKNTEGWTLSVDNYYKMLEQTNSTGIITLNYGYARYGTAANPVAQAAHLAADWVRYDKGKTKFWEVGNESNGTWQAGYRIKTSDNKDGQPQIITGALYGTHFKICEKLLLRLELPFSLVRSYFKKNPPPGQRKRIRAGIKVSFSKLVMFLIIILSTVTILRFRRTLQQLIY
jgi:hypothetical protein